MRGIPSLSAGKRQGAETFKVLEETPPKRLAVTVKEARRISGLGNTKIYELIAAGRLKAIKIGRRTLVKYSSLEELIDE